MSNPDEDQLVEIAEVSDADMFAAATALEPAADAPEPEAGATAAEPEPDGGPQRDAAGRFAAKTGDVPAPTEADGGQIPAWRLREEAENRRAAEARAQQFERELADLRRNPPKPAEPPKPEVKPDFLLMTSEEIESYFENKVQARFAAAEQARIVERGEESMTAARASSTEAFDKAYAEAMTLVKGGDAVTHARIFKARDPGKELLSWYRERENLRTVGDDPNAWMERQLAEAAKDPAKAAKLAGILRGQVQPGTPPPNNGLRQPSPVRIPPSLSSVTPSGAARGEPGDDDMSDEGLFRHATAGLGR